MPYFTLSPVQEQLYDRLDALYRSWNDKINLISRKDIDNLYQHHVLHSLAIAKIVPFTPGTRVVDVGTGGGFPGIPLAIMFPETEFTLVDSVGKKLKAVDDIASQLGLKNVTTIHSRMEDVRGEFDFAVSRAAMNLKDLVATCRKNISTQQRNCLPNGLICLKGGDLEAEVRPYRKIATVYSLSEFFEEEYFQTKKAIYLPLCK